MWHFDEEWEVYDIYVEHLDPKRCPVSIPAPGSPVRVAANVDVVPKPSYYIGHVLTLAFYDGQQGALISSGQFFSVEISPNRYRYQPSADYDAGTQGNMDTAVMSLAVFYGDGEALAQLAITTVIDP